MKTHLRDHMKEYKHIPMACIGFLPIQENDKHDRRIILGVHTIQKNSRQ